MNNYYSKHYNELHFVSREDYLGYIEKYITAFAETGGYMVVLAPPIFKAWMAMIAVNTALEKGTLEIGSLYFDSIPVLKAGDIKERIIHDRDIYKTRLFLIVGDFPAGNLEEIAKNAGVVIYRVIFNDIRNN